MQNHETSLKMDRLSTPRSGVVIEEKRYIRHIEIQRKAVK